MPLEITLQQFEAIPNDHVIRAVITSQFNANISNNLNPDVPLLFIVVKDYTWAIYATILTTGRPLTSDINYCKRNGDKISTEAVIRNLFPCTDEVWKLYNF